MYSNQGYWRVKVQVSVAQRMDIAEFKLTPVDGDIYNAAI